MSTLDQRFSTGVASGFEAKPGYVTQIGVVPGGQEKRNQMRSYSLSKWAASPIAKTEAQTQELNKYFHAAAGRTNPFPFRDYTDFEVASTEGVLSLVSSGTYQLFKRYVIGGTTRDRKIVRPVNAVVAGSGSYSVNTSNGLVASSGAAPTGWSGQFDCLVRFDSDDLSVSIITSAGSGDFLYTWGGIGIQEVRL